MCGVVGMVGRGPVNQRIYDALIVLQHRGQDAAGMATGNRGRLHLRKDNGLVQDVFQQRHIDRLLGHIGVGHVRYPTAGTSSSAEAQPMYVNSPYGITLAHNGNLTNSDALKADLFREDRRHRNTGSDSEVLLNVFAHQLQMMNVEKPDADNVFQAVRGTHERCRGAYAAAGQIPGGQAAGALRIHQHPMANDAAQSLENAPAVLVRQVAEQGDDLRRRPTSWDFRRQKAGA